MKHKILWTGLHTLEVSGRVNVYTEEEYQQLCWWDLVKFRYNF